MGNGLTQHPIKVDSFIKAINLWYREKGDQSTHIDLDIRLLCLDGAGDTRDEATSSNGDDHSLDIGDLFEDLEANCALAGQDERMIVSIHVGHSTLLAQFQRNLTGLRNQ